MTKSLKSTNTTLPIYITEEAREALFLKMQQVDDPKDLLRADYLETICLGKTYLTDRAYGQIRRLLKQEFKEWCAAQFEDYVNGGL